MIDYTTDIRQRLELPEKMPDELQQKRQTVLSKLKELQLEVEPLMKCMEEIKTRDTMKDSKTLINVLQSEYNVSFHLILVCSFMCTVRKKLNFHFRSKLI
jgi:translation initiation factor 3 subunit E